MTEKKLVDATCDKILAFFVASGKKMRFNELFRSLNRFGFKISKPTLSEHLKHLTKKKILKRKKKGKQNISYEFNWERFKHLHEAREDNETLKAYLKSKETQQSIPLDDQLIYVTAILSLRNLHHLRLCVLVTLEPEHAFE